MGQIQANYLSFSTTSIVIILCAIYSLNLISTTAAEHVNRIHANHSEHSIGLGHLCHHHKDCANESICSRKTYQDDLKLKVCQCDPEHANRVGNSCYVKPGHQCYFPEKDVYGRLLLVCMKEAECRSGMNKSSPGNGYCMCTDDPRADVAPFRYLDVEHEIRRCSAVSLFTFKTMGLSLMMLSLCYLLDF